MLGYDVVIKIDYVSFKYIFKFTSAQAPFNETCLRRSFLSCAVIQPSHINQDAATLHRKYQKMTNKTETNTRSLKAHLSWIIGGQLATQ
jgi:hypothetical protein